MAQSIDGIKVEVKAGLSVDERTFRICMNLISIYAAEQGMQGMLVEFNQEFLDGYVYYGIADMQKFDEIRWKYEEECSNR